VSAQREKVFAGIGIKDPTPEPFTEEKEVKTSTMDIAP